MSNIIWTAQGVLTGALGDAPAICEIKRVGKRFFIATPDGTLRLVSRENIKDIGKTIAQNDKTVRVQINCLSKAQVGRLANDLKCDSGKDVCIVRMNPKKDGAYLRILRTAIDTGRTVTKTCENGLKVNLGAVGYQRTAPYSYQIFFLGDEQNEKCK